MKNEHTVLLVALVVVTVNLCHGFAIKEPGAYTASFTKSSSSASAFSHASSSSYTFGGNVNPTDLEALKAQAVAQASAEANAGAGATAGATAGAVAGATAHATAGATSSNAVTGSTVSNSGAVASSNAGNNVDSLSSGGAGTDSNAISVSGLDDGAYKKIASDKYTTNYSSGSQTNYAVSGEYVQPQSNSVVTGCTSCKGQFPGPTGSIHDYKLVGSGALSGSSAISSGSGAQYQPVAAPLPQLPGSSGSIYSSKPVSGHHANSGSSSISSGTTYTIPVSEHVSPSLIATLPGPSGSIFDSKPAGAVSGASASAIAGASASSTTQKQTVIPVVSSPCSSGSGCGSAYHGTSGLANIIPTLPGASGSIYDSKPVSAGAGASAVSGSSSNVYNSGSTVQTVQPVVVPVVPVSGPSSNVYNSGSTGQTVQPVVVPVVPAYSGAGSVTNIPSSHPIVGPVCSYTPGSGKQCGGPVIQVSQTASESGSTSSNQYESGLVSTIPISHPVGPAFVSGSSQESGAVSSNQHTTDSGSVLLTPSIHPEIPEAGTYYINKPSQNVEAPLPSPTFSAQIPCADHNSCGSKTQKTSSGAVASAGAYATTQNSENSGIVYPVIKETPGQYSSVNHDQAHLSGGIVFQNEDGSYYNHAKPAIYKNSESGGYAVSSNPADNTGVLIGPDSFSKPKYSNSESGGFAVSTNSQENTGVLLSPGTGHLPIESDKTKEHAFSGTNIEKSDKTTHGASSFSSASASAQATEHTNTGTEVTIEKLKGTEVTPQYPAKPNCLTGNCGGKVNTESGIPIAVPCYGKYCSGGTTQVYIVEEKETYPNQYGNGYQGQGYYYGGSGANNGYANGQVLVNQGSQTYDVTNKNIKGSGYAGSYGGHYASIPLNPHSGYNYGCKSGKCGGLEQFPLFNIRNSALSGAYSSSGAFGGASAGSFASASAGATATAGSFAHV